MPEQERHWRPVVGEWVTYRPHPGAPAEDGEVKELREGGAMVLYRGDTTAKLTRIEDLSPGSPSSAWG